MTDAPNAIKHAAAESIFAFAEGSDILLLGDTDHRLSSIPAFVAGQDFMAEAKKNNITDICIEKAHDFRPLFEAYTNGTISADAFKFAYSKVYNGHQGDKEAAASTMVALLDNAKANNIEVHLIDRMQGVTVLDGDNRVSLHDYAAKMKFGDVFLNFAQTYDRTMAEIERAGLPLIDFDDYKSRNIFEEKYETALGGSVADKLREIAPIGVRVDIERRKSGDRDVAADISAIKNSSSGRVAVLYGVSHMTHDADIDSHLRKMGHQPMVVDVFDNQVNCSALSNALNQACALQVLSVGSQPEQLEDRGAIHLREDKPQVIRYQP